MRQNVTNSEVAALETKLPENSTQRLRELTDDCRLLVLSHMPLAYAMAWRMRDCGMSLDDLRQEGCLGLCEAALRYNENVDCTFATYASYWCRKMIYAAIERRKKTAESPHREQVEKDDDLLRIGQQHRIADALQDLSPRERHVVTRFYGLDGERQNLSEIAAAMDISKARASAIHRRALQRLETALLQRPLVNYLTLWLK